MKEDRKKEIAKQVEIARMSILEHALIAFVEDVLGRVPSDDEILKQGRHVQLADTPIATFEAQGKKFTQYFVWGDEHVVALGFISEKDPLALYIVRVPKDDWPYALKANIEAHIHADGESDA